MNTNDIQRDGIPDAVDEVTQADAAGVQAAEQERLDEEARRQLSVDPGDPRDRLSEPQQERLMEQTQQREFHA